MTIDFPQFTDLPHLRALWKQAFGDSDEFWFDFVHKAKPLRRCRCLWEDDTLAAALYWFDCSWKGKHLAYLYGVATSNQFRHRGFCRALMEDTHAHLKAQGYGGCILVPGSRALFAMYEKLGYTTCSYIREFECEAGCPIPIRPLSIHEYANLRREYLPADGVVQEGETLALLDAQAGFYAGENCVFVCSSAGGKLTVSELLGDEKTAPGILAAMDCSQGTFRTPGTEKPFAMYHSFTDDPTAPAYFGLAMD